MPLGGKLRKKFVTRKYMPWIQLRLSADEETAEKYSDWLSACGAQAVTFIDAKDTPIYESFTGR